MTAPHEKVGESHFRDLGRVLLKEPVKYGFVLDLEGFEVTEAHERVLKHIVSRLISSVSFFGHSTYAKIRWIL
jgi:hypothetical protein